MGTWLRQGVGMLGVGIACGLTVGVPEVWAERSVQEIAQIAQQVTVQVNDSRNNGGSGVLIDQQPQAVGYRYQVLTANHVVRGEDLSFQIQSTTGQSFPVTEVQPLQTGETDLDLAIVTFSASQELPVAQLGDSSVITVGSSVYVVGYPALPGQTGAGRNLEFSPGVITSRLTNPQTGGYSLRYNAVTRGGMSGGPVFDQEGQVIGIHGQGDIAGAVQTASGDVEVLKTGFNAAIPSQSFVALLNRSVPAVTEIPLLEPTAPPVGSLEQVLPTSIPSTPATEPPASVTASLPAEELLNRAFIGELKRYGVPFQDVLCRRTSSTTQRQRIADQVANAGIAAALVSPSQVNESYLSTLSQELRFNCRLDDKFF